MQNWQRNALSVVVGRWWVKYLWGRGRYSDGDEWTATIMRRSESPSNPYEWTNWSEARMLRSVYVLRGSERGRICAKAAANLLQKEHWNRLPESTCHDLHRSMVAREMASRCAEMDEFTQAHEWIRMSRRVACKMQDEELALGADFSQIRVYLYQGCADKVLPLFEPFQDSPVAWHKAHLASAHLLLHDEGRARPVLQSLSRTITEWQQPWIWGEVDRLLGRNKKAKAIVQEYKMG